MNNSLVIGAGPAGMSLYGLLKLNEAESIGLAYRASAAGKKMEEKLRKNNDFFEIHGAKKELEVFTSRIYAENFYYDFAEISLHWEYIFLCVPCYVYQAVLEKIPLREMKNLKSIILISPEFGSNFCVEAYLEKIGVTCNVISASNYFGATKFIRDAEKVIVSLKALKKKVYIGCNRPNGEGQLQAFQEFLGTFGIKAQRVENAASAESRNITLFVHSSLLINPLSLRQIFGEETVPQYMYKLFPEGPITKKTIRRMRRLWQEILSLYQAFSIAPFNLLAFLNDDNYPVRLDSLSRSDIENFTKFSEVRQEYLLYVRYSSLLIDPFALPNEKGEYFSFSSVPFPRVVIAPENKEVIIPRIPLEDYLKLKKMVFICQKIKTKFRLGSAITKYFELFVQQWNNKQGCHFSFANLTAVCEKEAQMIVEAIEGRQDDD